MNAAKVVIALLGAWMLIPLSAAQDSAKREPDASTSAKDGTSKDGAAAQRLELDEFKRSAARYRIASDAERPKNLVFREEPILRWTNPLRQTSGGAVFVWVADGRPEVVASFYRYMYEGQVVQDEEFQSLATTGLKATRDDQAVWVPRVPGILLAPIPGAPKPAATSAERLRQMRALAHEFHAFFDNPPDKSELRLLPKPLFRYEASRPDLADGALFAFVVTTDPEVLLMIEDRPVEGAPIWHYGFARMSMVNLRASHKDRNVWNVEWVNDLQDPSKPYVTLRAPDRRD